MVDIALSGPGSATVSDIEKSTIRAITWRIIPFLMVCYFLAFIDRVNVGFAALTMNKDIGLTPSIFGFGAGLFFVAYFLFEVPSNIALERVGARYWIARIMITWGALSAGMAFITGANSFYVLRFLLGAAEAGFFPGIILYLTYWFPAHYRGQIIALFMVAIPVSTFVGSSLSAILLGLDGTWGLRGWQWLFILEGTPTILFGVLSLFILRNGPADVTWLTPQQRTWLENELDSERRRTKTVGRMSLVKVLFNKYVLIGALIYGGSTGASAALSIWLPQILKSYGLTNMQTGLATSIPFASPLSSWCCGVGGRTGPASVSGTRRSLSS